MSNRALKQQAKADPMAEIAAINSVVSSHQLDRADALDFVAERARSLTEANGAALGLQDGDVVQCCATSGQAPPLNATIRADSGISGECLRTGASLLCEDTQTDARVDREACEALGIRSTAVVPVTSDKRTIGLLQVFDSEAQSFGNDHLLLLKMLADIVADLTRDSDKNPRGDDSDPGKKPVQNEDRADEPKARASWTTGWRDKFYSQEAVATAPDKVSRDEVPKIVPGSVVPEPSLATPDYRPQTQVDEKPGARLPDFSSTRQDKTVRRKQKGSFYISGMPRFGIDLACALLIALITVFFVVRFWQPLAHAQFSQTQLQKPSVVSAGLAGVQRPKPTPNLLRAQHNRPPSTWQAGIKTANATTGSSILMSKDRERASDAIGNRVGAVPKTHMNVTDPLAAYEIQSLDKNSIGQLISNAASGDPVAELHLGSAYELGRGVAQSCETAAQWIRKAAQQGNAAAEYNLGLRYAQGDGVTQDASEAHRWLKKAINQGYLARRALYETGPSGE